jgi:hypothetical protein
VNGFNGRVGWQEPGLDLEARLDHIRRVGEEIITEGELRALLVSERAADMGAAETH